MKIAILLTGHVRNYKETVKNFYTDFLSNIKNIGEYDIFLSIWDNDGFKKEHTPYGCKNTNIKLTQEQINDIFNTYQPKKMEVEEQDTVTSEIDVKAKLIVDKYLKLDKNNKSINHVIAVLSQLYKANRCYKLIDNVEDYDVIIKYRFDAYFKKGKKINWDQKELIEQISSFLYLQSKNKFFNEVPSFSDVLIIGNQECFKLYSRMYDDIFLNDILPLDLQHFSISTITWYFFHFYNQFEKLSYNLISNYNKKIPLIPVFLKDNKIKFTKLHIPDLLNSRHI